MATQPRPARGAAPAGLPPALRHPADQPVRRRGLPGEPGRRRAVQPGERRPTRPRSPPAFAVLLLPYSLIGPFAGVLLDRWRRQRVLVWSQPAALPAGRLVAIEIATRVEGVPFYATALLVTSVNRFFLAALSAAPAARRRAGGLVTGNALSTTSGSVAAAVGAGIALLLRQARRRRRRRYAADRLASVAGYRLVGARWPAGSGRTSSGRTTCSARAGRPCSTSPAGWSPAPGTWRAARGRRRRWPRSARTGSSTGSRRSRILLLYRNYFTDDGIFRRGLAGLGQVFAATAARHADRGRDHPGGRSAGSASRPGSPAVRAGRADRDRVRRCRSRARRSCRPRCCSASSRRARRSAWTRWCRSRSRTTSGAGCSPSTTRCSTYVRAAAAVSRRSCCPLRQVVRDARRRLRRVRAHRARPTASPPPGRAGRSRPEPPLARAGPAALRQPSVGDGLVVRQRAAVEAQLLEVPPGLADQRAGRQRRGSP